MYYGHCSSRYLVTKMDVSCLEMFFLINYYFNTIFLYIIIELIDLKYGVKKICSFHIHGEINKLGFKDDVKYFLNCNSHTKNKID